MFAVWGRTVVRHRRVVVIVAALFALFGAIWGTGLFGGLSAGGFDDPASESSRAAAAIEAQFGHTGTDLVVVIDGRGRTVDDPEFATDTAAAFATLPPGAVSQLRTWFDTGAPTMVTADRTRTYAAVTLADGGTVSDDDLTALRAAFTDRGYGVGIGGPDAVNREINDTVGADIVRAELISMPVLLVLLVVIFGSVVSALLPLIIGGLAILGAFVALRVIDQFAEVSVFAVNLVTLMGLGLAIDYGLLIVGRFREEVAAGHSTAVAVGRTVQTAGRTVAVSALTVAVSLAGLTLFPITFLRSMAYGGMSAVVVAGLSAVLVLPAILAMLGPRIDSGSVRRRRPERADDSSGFWFRLAQSVMRRPGRYLLASGLVLAVMFVPFFGVTFGGIDERVLPADAETRIVSATLAADFGVAPGNQIITAVALDEAADSGAGSAAVQEYLAVAGRLPGATGATVEAAGGTLAVVAVSFDGDPQGAVAKTLVADLRDVPAPAGVTSVLVGGLTAQVIDRLDTIGSRLPWMGLLIAGATFVLLFLAFGSVVLPVKAILMNLLSLGASLGVVTWIFQDGHLSGLLDFESTGFVEATQPILVLAIVFGLSMDYEVFLLARIREQWDLTGDNRLAVATGLQRTGRTISSAALLIIVVIAAFSTSSITFIKLIGVAMLVAVAVDALLVRMFVVPATMRLLGATNWWAPAPLARFWRRYGFREELPATPGPADQPPARPTGRHRPAGASAHVERQTPGRSR